MQPRLPAVLATQSGTQRIGFLYKTEVFSNVVIQHILTSFAQGSGNPFAGRAPLQLEADVTLGNETRRLKFIVLHMKCCSDNASYLRRVEAAQRLKNNLDFLPQKYPIIILGDFNDELIVSFASQLANAISGLSKGDILLDLSGVQSMAEDFVKVYEWLQGELRGQDRSLFLLHHREPMRP